MEYSVSEKQSYLGLSLLPQIGSRTLVKLIEYFGSAERAWRSPLSEYKPLNLPEKVFDSIVNTRPKINLEQEWQKIDQSQTKVLILGEDKYPSLLREISDPPVILYYQGEVDWNSSLFFAIVGTRKLTSYGKRVIEDLVPSLVSHRLVIVSGFALGGDTAAHQMTLDSGGQTVGVLGSGLGEIYPASNHKLAEKIRENGALLSEFSLFQKPQKQFFPMRNRIISGLSVGTLIVEASEKSGTLITASCANEQNREVFAVPGSIFNPYSIGPSKLIQSGAKLVTCVEDILTELNIDSRFQSQQVRAMIPETVEEKKISGILGDQEYVMMDQLIRLSGLEPKIIIPLLTTMEMKGLIKDLGNGKFCLC